MRKLFFIEGAIRDVCKLLKPAIASLGLYRLDLPFLASSRKGKFLSACKAWSSL